MDKNQREHDLVRQMRCELFMAKLITQDEYSALASEHGGVQRLETYDELRAENDYLARRISDAEQTGYHNYEGGACPWCNNCLEHQKPVRPGAGEKHCVTPDGEVFSHAHTPTCPAFIAVGVVRRRALAKSP